MKNKKFSVFLTIIFCSLMTHAQNPPPPPANAPSAEPNPLDVIEPKKESEAKQPTVPEFKEVPAPDAAQGTVESPAGNPGAETPPPPPKTAKHKKKRSKKHVETSPLGNDPDFAKETRFHNIYKKFNTEPTSAEAWEKAVGKRNSENYHIQKGNTLWDVSNTFFGDPNFWPKIWSFNGSIGNPHEIDPSMTIRFYPGSAENAPTVELTQAKEEKDEVVAQTEVYQGGKRKRIYVPVLNELPESLPSKRVGIYKQRSKVEVQILKRNIGKGLEYLGYYLSEEPLKGAGVVTASEMDLKSVGDFVYIYVQLDHLDGKDYVVQKNLAQIKSSSQSRQATMVEVQGQIEVLEQVNVDRKIYRALVKKTIAPIEVGSIIAPGVLPMVDPHVDSIASGPGAQIIGGQFGTGRMMFGSNSLIFIDAGTSRGVSEGASYGIYADEAVRNSETDAVQNNRQIGVVKIVNVTANYATGYVTKSTDDIRRGDFVGVVTKTAMATPNVDEPSAAPGESKAAPADDLEKELDLDNTTPSAPPAAAPSGSGTDDSELEL
ncbi:MAG TPA: hypothetical protein VN132_04270 [Bdellovibrio sp.]|nr:hypothetical protein [Bdellovibrio sp.]